VEPAKSGIEGNWLLRQYMVKIYSCWFLGLIVHEKV